MYNYVISEDRLTITLWPWDDRSEADGVINYEGTVKLLMHHLNVLVDKGMTICTLKTDDFLTMSMLSVEDGDTLYAMPGKEDEIQTTDPKLIIGALIELGEGYEAEILEHIKDNASEWESPTIPLSDNVAIPLNLVKSIAEFSGDDKIFDVAGMDMPTSEGSVMYQYEKVISSIDLEHLFDEENDCLMCFDASKVPTHVISTLHHIHAGNEARYSKSIHVLNSSHYELQNRIHLQGLPMTNIHSDGVWYSFIKDKSY